MSEKLTGAQILIKTLLDSGVDHVFCVDSPEITPLTRAMNEAAGRGLKVVRARDEIAAAAMANAFTSRSKVISAVITGRGGRALAQVSAVTNAWADKVPILSISVCEDRAPDPNKGVERRLFNQMEVFKEVTRCRHRAGAVDEIPAIIARGLAGSVAGKMGPFHLDIPGKLLNETAGNDYSPAPKASAPATFEPVRMPGDEESISRAVSVLMSSKRPLVFTGAGAVRSEAMAAISEFLARSGIPATHSMAGMGSIAPSCASYIGGPSYTAGEVFHYAIRKADCVLALGTAFGGLEGFGLPPLWSGKTKFIHVDIDPLQVGLNVSPGVPIQADANTALLQIIKELEARKFAPPAEWAPWRNRLLKMKEERARRLIDEAYAVWPVIHQGRLAHELGKKVMEDDLLMVIDGGNTALYAAMYGPAVKPRQSYFPYGMAALGAGVPAAVGMQVAEPGRRVMLCTGDGSMLYNVQELETIAQMNLPIMIVVNNDSSWNMIRCAQTSMYACNYIGTDLPDTDYAKMAAGFGFHAERVTRAEEIVPAYIRARDSGKPALIDVVTDKTNYPDSLISFALVEFEGAEIDPGNALAGLWKSRTDGWKRIRNRIAYIRKSFLSM